MTTDPEPHVLRVGDDQGRGGLYNMVVPGGFDRGAVLLPLLGFTGFDALGRFRDAWVEPDPGDGQLLICVYTRNGGGNRPDYADVIAALAAHPAYLRDADDAFDSTYASFWFRVPPEHVELLRPVALDAPLDTGARWQAMVNAMGARRG